MRRGDRVLRTLSLHIASRHHALAIGLFRTKAGGDASAFHVLELRCRFGLLPAVRRIPLKGDSRAAPRPFDVLIPGGTAAAHVKEEGEQDECVHQAVDGVARRDGLPHPGIDPRFFSLK